jgi:hypothetical protein
LSGGKQRSAVHGRGGGQALQQKLASADGVHSKVHKTVNEA